MPPQISRLALIMMLCAVGFADRPGGFRVIGPGGGGAMFHPTVSPHDPNTVLVSCDMTGAYITHDAGRSWRMFNLRGTVQFFVFDPIDPKVIYAKVTGLWRSKDGGETWHLVYPKPSAIHGIEMSSDHADEAIVADPDPIGSMAALAIDPADSNTLFAVSGDKQHGTLFISHDSGESWHNEATLPERPRHIWIDPHSPKSSRTLFIGGPRYLSVRKQGQLQNLPTPVEFIDMAAGIGTAQPTFYAFGKEAAFVSTDGGASWQKCVLPGSGGHVQAIAASAHHPEVAYLSYNHLRLEGQDWMGVAKSVDSGRSWNLVWKEAHTAASNMHDAWITPRFGPDWGENPLMLTVADQNADLSYATDLGRTMQTTNGGETWDAVYSRKAGSGDWTSTGLDVTTNYGFHFDPFDPKRQFITYTDIGLFRSEDSGESWASSTNGVPKAWVNTTYWVVFDPVVRGRMWSVNSGTHDLPRPKMWRRTPVQRFTGGVCRSDDGGKTWVKSNEGLPETAATHLLLDPTSPQDARVLYVAGFGRGVFKSTDGGHTWKLKNRGITQSETFAWRLARDGNGDLYVLVARRSENGSIGNSGDGALYRSTDGAETWSPVALPNGVNGPNGLAIDPQSPSRLYLAAWARATGMHGEGGGIFLSTDAGQSWRNVLDKDQHVYDVTIDPRDPKVLYAAGFESSVWRSADRGETWTRIPGFNFKWAHRVIPDPEHPDMIYVTTFGGSVWHGSVNGKPQPVDIATPPLEPGR